MSDDEKTLAAQVARELLARTPPQTEHERQMLRHTAEEIAAEMIWAARGEAASDEDEWDEEVLGPDPLRSTLGEETEGQANSRMWLEDLEDEVTEELAKQQEYEEYKRQQQERPPQA